MKVLGAILILGLSLFSYSQNREVKVGLRINSGKQVFYKGYKNELEIYNSENYDTLFFQTDIKEYVEIKDSLGYKLFFENSDRDSLNSVLYGVLKEDTVEISRASYPIKELPLPELYINNVEVYTGDSCKRCKTELEFYFGSGRLIFVRHFPNYRINEKFEVLEWEFTIDDKSYYGSGKFFSEEVLEAIYNSKIGTAFILKSITAQSEYRTVLLTSDFVMIKTFMEQTFRPGDCGPIICTGWEYNE